ncbi:hypothetical protein M9H77_35706 [Catharanthus roseus]|uniref:Uncharacterized protein n=1 Tax=Catharanthus roseus TaxID=4058 RepID=A0ACB9ZPR8_CATRO|nr:hypothetical protein M9H77_35706 [Catharanthus roseus]
MAITNFNVEYQSSVSPEKMFKVLIADAPRHHPKLLPQIIKSIEQNGSIITTTYTDGSQLKVKADSIDPQNLTCKHTFLHGEMIKNDREFLSTEYKFEPASNGGSIIKVKGECRTKNGSISDHAEEKEGINTLCKLAEEYLVANPTACA